MMRLLLQWVLSALSLMIVIPTALIGAVSLTILNGLWHWLLF
jgi:hypothetical protein